jgi:CubicO group peptidase (beta-lactamase class C family)
MATHRKKVTRRAALARLAGVGGLTVAAQVGGRSGKGTARAEQVQPPPRPLEVPIKGKAGPGLEPFDPAMLKIMDRHGIPGAALAIAKDGKLVLAKGYGWANIADNVPIQPDTLFGLASLSKPITAVATLKLVEQGKLGLDDKVFDLVKGLTPPRGIRVDPRLFDVTVRQCLNHSGGWDREVEGDPVNWEPQICRAFRLKPPLSARQFLSFVLGLVLDFKPGTEAKYSNIGYIILGEVIRAISGQSYERFVVENVLKPMDVKQIGLHAFDGKYLVGEALRYLAGTYIVLPPNQFPMIDAAGGWSGSVVDLARFLTNLDGSRGKPVLSEKMRKLMIEPPPEPIKPRANGSYFGLGWDTVLVNDKGVSYFKDGSYQGMRTYLKRLPTGVNWALLFNASMEFDPQDLQYAASTVREVRQLVEGLGKYPDVDLFKEFP